MKYRVIGQPLVDIAHSAYSEPEFVIDGIGPASFRSHFLILANGIVLDLFTAELTVVSLPGKVFPGETSGIMPSALIGLRVVAVVRDDTQSVLVILEGGIFLKDANDGVYGNPLLAGRLVDHYTHRELAGFIDDWSGEPALLETE